MDLISVRQLGEDPGPIREATTIWVVIEEANN